MRRDFVPPLAQVDLDRRRGVDRVPLVRVNRHAKEARVGLQYRWQHLSVQLRTRTETGKD